MEPGVGIGDQVRPKAASSRPRRCRHPAAGNRRDGNRRRSPRPAISRSAPRARSPDPARCRTPRDRHRRRNPARRRRSPRTRSPVGCTRSSASTSASRSSTESALRRSGLARVIVSFDPHARSAAAACGPDPSRASRDASQARNSGPACSVAYPIDSTRRPRVIGSHSVARSTCTSVMAASGARTMRSMSSCASASSATTRSQAAARALSLGDCPRNPAQTDHRAGTAPNPGLQSPALQRGQRRERIEIEIEPGRATERRILAPASA